ncbi:MAG: aminotransferase class I/II-fold pyridoxal phosphate-dependent enzyme, partial [Crocinitomicaceae bacterium]
MSKLPHVGTTIFTVMSKLAAENKAINLSQGFPNFPVDPKLLDLYQRKVKEDVHQYAPMPGNPRLLAEIGALIESSYDRRINPSEEILVTAGATQGIFTAITALINKEDEVIILDPS